MCDIVLNRTFVYSFFRSRSANHDMKSGKNNSQLPSEDVDLDISQSTSSDLELSSCSATTNSDIVSLLKAPICFANDWENNFICF